MLVMLLISGLYLSIPRNPNATQGLDDYASISKKKRENGAPSATRMTFKYFLFLKVRNFVDTRLSLFN